MPGRSSSTTAERLVAHGPNELPTGRGRILLTQFVDVLREPMVALLVGYGLARGFHKVLRMALTVPDMARAEMIEETNVAEAIGYRVLDHRLAAGQ